MVARVDDSATSKTLANGRWSGECQLVAVAADAERDGKTDAGDMNGNAD